MAGTVNKVILVGHLGADPESRSMGDGGKVVNLRLATSQSWNDRDGNRQERTEWHRVVIFNDKLGEVAEKYLRKGAKVYVEGALQTRKWTDQSGAEKYATEVVLQKFRGELTLLDKREDGGRSDYSSHQQGNRPPASKPGGEQGGFGGNFNDDLDDDVPF